MSFGLTEFQLEALEKGDWAASPLFSKEEKLVIAYATHGTRDPRRLPDDLFDELRASFNQAQIIELTVRISMCNFFNRFNDALRLDSSRKHWRPLQMPALSNSPNSANYLQRGDSAGT